ncbi:ribosome silencing factor [Leucobacter sp. M11]|uniref:ribosome silencing factor n=1 Tax=Leucobacter sp. M11 TaxID=2993565 RepID=UPI002D807442|nr:ribosome silencing factor [Leucobacter sp. M11]MEB4616077.1 ribosome silencing factor [Leucobacter sp. M11]
MTASPQSQTDLSVAVFAADEKGATDLVALDVKEQFALSDIFLMASGNSERNVQAISDNIEDRMLQSGVKTIRREGRQSGRWVLLDFGDLIVHVFHHEERGFYDLERLWKDCPALDTPVKTAEELDLVNSGEPGVE